MSIGCRFQTSVFDNNSEQNFITCFNTNCENFGSYVNSFMCQNCTLCEIREQNLLPERNYTKRPQDLADLIFDTSCSRCPQYNKKNQNCQALSNSKTIFEIIENAERRCPRKLW